MRLIVLFASAFALLSCASAPQTNGQPTWVTAGGFTEDPNGPAETLNPSAPVPSGTPVPGSTDRRR